jgi:hypothetical protein
LKPAALRERVDWLVGTSASASSGLAGPSGLATRPTTGEARRGTRRRCGPACANLAAARPRFGYPRLHIMLRREGWHVNIKRVYRLYKLEGPEVRTKKRRKRASHLRVVLPTPTAPNERWSMDFMRDTFEDGRPFRILTVVDTFTRECPLLAADTSLSGKRVADPDRERPCGCSGCAPPRGRERRPEAGGCRVRGHPGLQKQHGRHRWRPSTRKKWLRGPAPEDCEPLEAGDVHAPIRPRFTAATVSGGPQLAWQSPAPEPRSSFLPRLWGGRCWRSTGSRRHQVHRLGDSHRAVDGTTSTVHPSRVIHSGSQARMAMMMRTRSRAAASLAIRG